MIEWDIGAWCQRSNLLVGQYNECALSQVGTGPDIVLDDSRMQNINKHASSPMGRASEKARQLKNRDSLVQLYYRATICNELLLAVYLRAQNDES